MDIKLSKFELSVGKGLQKKTWPVKSFTKIETVNLINILAYLSSLKRTEVIKASMKRIVVILNKRAKKSPEKNSENGLHKNFMS